jgi:serine/threonine-protein kinase RsbW
MGMEVQLSLSLPRDRSTVPLTRRVLDAALAVFKVTKECRDDIGLAVGEACANAVEHAETGADYHVTVTILEDQCVIDVVDQGPGIDPGDGPEAGPYDEAGRGLRIIRALADKVELRRDKNRGAGLRIIKNLAIA